jgi:WD40-like Beta Propeller Repeat
MLPGGKSVLYTSYRRLPVAPSKRQLEDNVFLVVQPLPGGTTTVVHRGGYYGRYVPSGHLLYVHDDTLFAVPFDNTRREKTGPPVPVLKHVYGNVGVGAEYAFSSSGTLLYYPGGTSNGRFMFWMNRDGKTRPLRSTAASWANVLFSPDGRRLTFQSADGDAKPDVWVYDWSRDFASRLTSDPSSDIEPVWTPDGRRIVFASNRGDKMTFNLYWQRADGAGDATGLTSDNDNQSPSSWHPSGRFLAFTRRHSDEFNAPVDRSGSGSQSWASQYDRRPNSDVMVLPIDGNEQSGWKPGTATAFLNTPFNESQPMFSPDGRWIAYMADETGRNEVYVRPFPGPGGKWQISIDGGEQPTWSRSKNELFYINDNNRLVVASYSAAAASFRAEKPRLLTDAYTQPSGGNRLYDVHPDGERLVVKFTTAPYTPTANDRIIFISNFFDELRRLAPVK